MFRLLWPELEAVYEEKNIALDDPDERVYEALMRGLFPEHPYGTQPIIGRIEHLKTPAYDDMVRFFRDYYVPENMAIVLAGDVPSDALTTVERTFGRLPPKPVGTPARASQRGPRGRRVLEVEAQSERSVTIGWRTAAVGDADEAALRVLDGVLDNSQSGLLNVELELSQRVPDAESWIEHFRDGGYLAIGATARDGQELAEVEAMLMDVVHRIRSGPVNRRLIDAVLLDEEIATKRVLESNDDRAEWIIDAFTTGRSWSDELALQRRIATVTAAEVTAVARRVLGDDRVVVLRTAGTPTPPKIAKPPITPVEIDPKRRSAFARRVEASATETLEPRFWELGRDYARAPGTGGPVIAVLNERNDLFSLTYAFVRGYRDEPLWCHGLGLWSLSGAGSTPADALQSRFHALGTTVDVSCDGDSSAVTVEGIDRNLEASLRLLDRWLADPRLPAPVADRMLRNTLSRRRDHLDDPQVVAEALAAFAHRGDDSPWRRLPSDAELRAAVPDTLLARASAVMSQPHRTLYFGPRSLREVAGIIGRGPDPGRLPTPAARRFRRVDRPTVFFVAEPVAKSQIEVVWPGSAADPSRRVLGRVWEEYLDGNMSSLLFQEIREARGLAYRAEASFDTGIRLGDDAGLWVGLGTQADKTTVALETLDAVLRRPLLPSRLRAAKTAIDESMRSAWIDPRQGVWWVVGWERWGESGDPRPRIWNAIRGATADSVERLRRDALTAAPIIAVLGDPDRIDMTALRKLGRVVELEPSALFSYGP